MLHELDADRSKWGLAVMIICLDFWLCVFLMCRHPLLRSKLSPNSFPLFGAGVLALSQFLAFPPPGSSVPAFVFIVSSMRPTHVQD